MNSKCCETVWTVRVYQIWQLVKNPKANPDRHLPARRKFPRAQPGTRAPEHSWLSQHACSTLLEFNPSSHFTLKSVFVERWTSCWAVGLSVCLLRSWCEWRRCVSILSQLLPEHLSGTLCIPLRPLFCLVFIPQLVKQYYSFIRWSHLVVGWRKAIMCLNCSRLHRLRP